MAKKTSAGNKKPTHISAIVPSFQIIVRNSNSLAHLAEEIITFQYHYDDDISGVARVFFWGEDDFEKFWEKGNSEKF